jgi:hypothetical protein
MKIDVGQKRRSTSALGRPLFHLYSLPILQHAGIQPFLMSRTTRRSATRYSMNFTSHSWEIPWLVGTSLAALWRKRVRRPREQIRRRCTQCVRSDGRSSGEGAC